MAILTWSDGSVKDLGIIMGLQFRNGIRMFDTKPGCETGYSIGGRMIIIGLPVDWLADVHVVFLRLNTLSVQSLEWFVHFAGIAVIFQCQKMFEYWWKLRLDCKLLKILKNISKSDSDLHVWCYPWKMENPWFILAISPLLNINGWIVLFLLQSWEVFDGWSQKWSGSS